MNNHCSDLDLKQSPLGHAVESNQLEDLTPCWCVNQFDGDASNRFSLTRAYRCMSEARQGP